jgi:hypothetical protein
MIRAALVLLALLPRFRSTVLTPGARRQPAATTVPVAESGEHRVRVAHKDVRPCSAQHLKHIARVAQAFGELGILGALAE